MTTLLDTPTTDALAGALDGLAAAAASAHDDPRTRAVLAVVVQHLEGAAGAPLGATDDEPLVVLQRRFGRAHALLADRPTGLEPALLLGLATAVERPGTYAAPAPRPASPCPVPATC